MVDQIMDKVLCFRPATALGLFLILVVATFAQNAPKKKILVVNGRTADEVVVQIDGHSYVDVETLARIMNATVSFEPGRVMLTVPAIEAGTKTERTAPGFSKDFAKAGIPNWRRCGSGKARLHPRLGLELPQAIGSVPGCMITGSGQREA